MDYHSRTDKTRICRTCMQDIAEQTSANMYEHLNPKRPSLSGMLSTICPVVFSSGENLPDRHGMPEQICPSCELQIEAAYELHQTCIESDRKLCEMFLVKQEEIQIEEVQIEMPPEYEEEQEEESIYEKTDQLEHDEEMEMGETSKTLVEKGNVPKIRRKHNRIKPKKNLQQECSEPLSEPNLDELKSKIGTTKDASNEAGLTCVYCKIKFKQTNLLKSHLRIDHASQVFPCDSCNNVYLKEAELVAHKIFHETGRAYGCPICGKRYKYASNLRQHRNVHKADAALLCPICGKPFYNKSSLNQHMSRHSEKNFACDQCPAKFFLKGDLKSHQQTHSKEKNFVCDICNTRYTVKQTLIKHMKKHAGNHPTYPCDVCDRTFSSSSHAKRHKLTHTGEKPYKCTECDRSFTQSNDLVKHSKIHFGDNPYQCDRCDESFRLISNLRDHYKVHAGIDQSAGDGEESDKHTSVSKRSTKLTSCDVLKRRFQRHAENSSDEDPEAVGNG